MPNAPLRGACHFVDCSINHRMGACPKGDPIGGIKGLVLLAVGGNRRGHFELSVMATRTIWPIVSQSASVIESAILMSQRPCINFNERGRACASRM